MGESERVTPKIVGIYYVKEKKRSDRWEYRFNYNGFSSRQSFCISKHGFDGARKKAEKALEELHDRFDLNLRMRF